MEPTLFKEKVNALKKKQGEVKKFWDDRDEKIAKSKEADPNFADTDLSADDKKKLDTLHGELKDLSDEVESFNEYKTVAGRAETLLNVLGQPVNRPQYADLSEGGARGKTAGQTYIDSKQYKDLMSYLQPAGPNSGPISDQLKIDPICQPFNMKEFISLAHGRKGLVFSNSTSGGAFVRREYAENEILPLRPLTIRELITNSRTGSNLIEFVRQVAKTRAAAVVPEATATSGGGYTAAAKPEASMQWEIAQTAVKTVAVHMPITRQILADAPQLESEINNFLTDDAELKLEEEIITGSGGSTHFDGLENTPGITPQSFVTDMLTTTRKARTTAQIVARSRSTGFLLNPYDWESLDLLKDSQGRYYWGGPMVLGTKMLWGLPVAESEVIYQGTGYTGDLKKIQVWDREEPTLRMTDSHSDEFTHNIIRILLELRAAMAVKRPAAIVKMDLVQGANS